MRKITRREAFRLCLGGGVAVGSAYIGTQRDALRYAPAILKAKWDQLRGTKATVALVACPTYADAVRAVKEAWDLVGGPPVRDKRVVLKPNLVEVAPGLPVHTAPEVLEAAILYLREAGAREVVVADGPSFSRDTEALLVRSGYGEMLRRQSVEFVDLNYDDLDEVPIRGNYGGRLTSLSLPRTITRADLVVSVPKLKTHHWTRVSLSMKNLLGVVPGIKYGWPKNSLHLNGIPASILALCETVKPGLALIDGVVGLEGDGPVYGTPKPAGVIVMGTDLVATDATAARVMAVDPTTIPYLYLADALGFGAIGASRVEVRGLPLDQAVRPFVPAPSM